MLLFARDIVLTCDVVSIEDFGGVFELTGGLSWDASLKTTGISLRLAPGTVGGFILYFLSTSSSTSSLAVVVRI